MTGTTQKRSLRVDPNIIKTVIGAQAGSLQKAMMEAVANSMDAGATRVDVEVTPNKVIIRDNGKGLSKAEEIFQVFEVFGFDHSGLDRTHGRFGVGRGQLFCYGANRWRTHTFEMALDIEKDGLDYQFRDDLKPSKGMSIEIDLYHPLNVRSNYELDEAFKELVKYSTVPIHYNGKLISKDPTKVKWALETDDAWFSLRRDGAMKIYSQGLYVMNSYQQGVGGEVVTKSGHALALNMARNDILRDKCTVWPQVQKTLRAEARKLADKGIKQNTLNDLQRRAMAQEALDPANVDDLLERPLFTLTNNKHLSLTKLLTRQVAMAPKGDRRADVLLQRQTLYALSPETLERFGVDTAAELHERLAQSLTKAVTFRQKKLGYGAWKIKGVLNTLKASDWKEDLGEFDHLVDVNYTELAPKDLNASEKAALVAVRRMGEQLHLMMSYHQRETDSNVEFGRRRMVQAMVSDSAEAMTDGLSKIWIERGQLALVKRGLPGFIKLLNLLVHEYTHRSSSQGSHLHDQDFFESFHNTVMEPSVARLAVTGLATYAKHAPKANSTLLSHIDMALDPSDQKLFQNDGQAVLMAEDLAAEVEAQAEVAKAKPKRRVRGG